MVADRRRLAAYHSKHCRRAFQWYQHRWPWTTLNPQNRGFSDFLAILGWNTTLSVNCAKAIEDRPGQPAYEMFGIKRRFQQCRAWPRRFKESSVRARQIWAPPWKVRFLLLSPNLARDWLQIDTDLLLIITTTADELSGGTNIDDLERPWSPKIGFLVNF